MRNYIRFIHFSEQVRRRRYIGISSDEPHVLGYPIPPAHYVYARARTTCSRQQRNARHKATGCWEMLDHIRPFGSAGQSYQYYHVMILHVMDSGDRNATRHATGGVFGSVECDAHALSELQTVTAYLILRPSRAPDLLLLPFRPPPSRTDPTASTLVLYRVHGRHTSASS